MEFHVSSHAKQELVDITDNINEAIRSSEIKNGLCHVFVTHATAAILVNENYDADVCNDFLKAINQIIPEHNNYLHDRVDNNAAAHIKAALVGPGELLPVRNGRLYLGNWQSVMIADFDGPRKRAVVVSMIKS